MKITLENRMLNSLQTESAPLIQPVLNSIELKTEWIKFNLLQYLISNIIKLYSKYCNKNNII